MTTAMAFSKFDSSVFKIVEQNAPLSVNLVNYYLKTKNISTSHKEIEKSLDMLSRSNLIYMIPGNYPKRWDLKRNKQFLHDEYDE